MKQALFFIFLAVMSNSAFSQTKANTPLYQYPNLKAVLVVGHLEDATKDAMQRMDDIAEVFIKYGVKACKFYNENADWDSIKKEATNAHFFVYAGHGTYAGRGRSVGGLVLKTTVSVDQMVKELKFTQHPLIIFQSVCMGAGSSADDDSDIGIKLAEIRVTYYSSPFFEIGASAYFANNKNGACANFVDYFLKGKPLQVCYGLTTDTVTYIFGLKINSRSNVAKIEIDRAYQKDQSLKISICSETANSMITRITYINGKKKVEQVPNYKQYDAAYVGKEGFTIKDLLKYAHREDAKISTPGRL